MIRILVILVAMFGALVLLTRFFPSSQAIAFHVGDHAVPWFALGVCALGYAAYRVTK